MNSVKTDLEMNCRAAAKEVKTFVRDKNLELNAAQHEGYKDLRAIRSGMEETVTSSRREVRECTMFMSTMFMSTMFMSTLSR